MSMMMTKMMYAQCGYPKANSVQLEKSLSMITEVEIIRELGKREEVRR